MSQRGEFLLAGPEGSGRPRRQARSGQRGFRQPGRLTRRSLARFGRRARRGGTGWQRGGGGGGERRLRRRRRRAANRGHSRCEVHDVDPGTLPAAPRDHQREASEGDTVRRERDGQRGEGQPSRRRRRGPPRHGAESRGDGVSPRDADGGHRALVGSVTMPSFSIPERRTRSMVSTTNPYCRA